MYIILFMFVHVLCNCLEFGPTFFYFKFTFICVIIYKTFTNIENFYTCFKLIIVIIFNYNVSFLATKIYIFYIFIFNIIITFT